MNEAVCCITSDVSFGLTDPRTGFDKIDVYTALTPGRGAHVLLTALIIDESARTFVHNFEALASLYPYLRTEEFVLIIDGDPAKIQAARHVFPCVVIILCIKHLLDNFKSRRRTCWSVEDGDEGLELTYVCNCRLCGREMPFLTPAENPAEALVARCQQCEEAGNGVSNTSSSSSGSSSTGATSWFARGANLMASAASGAAAAVTSLLSGQHRSDDQLFQRAMESPVTWHMCWEKLRNAPSLPECKRLLELLKRHHPAATGYVDYLWRNVGLWAVCAFVWKPTFG